jgi:type I restriction enzyme S subunit
MTDFINGTLLQEAGLINLPSDWNIVEIQDLLALDRGISVGVMYPGEHDPHGIPLVKVGDLTSNSINLSPEFRITPEKHYEYRRTALEGGELLVTLVGALGHCAVVPESMKGWNAARAIAVLRLKNPEDAYFVRVCVLSPPLNRLINVWANTSVQPTINLKEVKKLPIPFPALKERKKIVQFISCLDRKISNLRQQNETLEKIAQSLFKHWFVDFEFPNEDGKPYRSSGGEMVRSEHLGEIPAGWKIGKSGDLIVLQGGFAFKSKDFKSFGEHGIIKIRNISGSVVDVNQTDFIPTLISQNIDKKFQINSGDVLIAMTGAEVAKVGVVPKTTKSLWLNQRVGLFREIVQGGKLFIYYLFTRETHQKILRDKGSGSSAQPNISATDIESIVLIRPSENILRLFNKISQPLFQKKCDNLQQIQTLTETRDRLLPKLMSGQLRIPQL